MPLQAASANSSQPDAARDIRHEESSGTAYSICLVPDGTAEQAGDAHQISAPPPAVQPPSLLPEIRSNIVPTLCTLDGQSGRRRWAVQPLAPYTLGDLLRQPASAEAQILHDGGGQLLLYQLVSGLAELHSAGKWHGRLGPEHVLLTRDGCGLEMKPQRST